MKCLVALVAMAGLVGPARADEKGDPTGTWAWTVVRDGKKLEARVTLRLEGDRLTGFMKGRNGIMKVEEGTYKDGEVVFQIPGKNPDGRMMMHRYKGKLDGDRITGKFTIELFDKSFTKDWDARRVKD